MKVIAIANQKGGVGKTTTAVNLAACLAHQSRRVLLVDLDSQANATQHLSVSVPEGSPTAFELLVSEDPQTRAVIVPAGPNLAIVPGHIALAEIDLALSSALDREGRLARALELVEDDYDYVLVDCPPSLGWATLNALCAASYLLVAAETSYFALDAVKRLMLITQRVKKLSNPGLDIWALATMHKAQANIHKQSLAQLESIFGPYLLATRIRHTVAFIEAAASGQSIVDYGHGSRGHQDYQCLAKEVIRRAEAQAGIQNQIRAV